MDDVHTTNRHEEEFVFIRGRHRSPVQRNSASIFSSIRGTRPTRNPTAQQRVADLNQGEILTSEDFDEPLASDTSPGRKRVMGLHRGVAWVSEDFDKPLPDEFWLGGDE
jgi:hypothetical protein